MNTIFRVAHSIKGGAATFGFNEVASFMHTLETLLDELRSQQSGKPVSAKAVADLQSDAPNEAIGQAFDWAEGDSELRVEPRVASAPARRRSARGQSPRA